jgi:hypothetical protein
VTKAAKYVEIQPRFGCLLDYCETPNQQPFCDAETEIRFHTFKTCPAANQTTRTEQRKLNPAFQSEHGRQALA